MTRTVTACLRNCPDACSMITRTDTQGRIRLRGNPDHPFTDGFTCLKSAGFISRLKSPHRITRPRLKTGSGWQEIGWEEAFDLAADKIRDLAREPERMLYADCDGDHGVARLAAKALWASLGAGGVSGVQICNAGGLAACRADFGEVDQNQPEDLDQAKVIVNWGRDLQAGWVHLAARVARARRAGARLITITPGGESGPAPDQRILIRPGRDRFLAAAVIRRLVELDVIRERVLARAANWPDFRALVGSWEEEALLRECGVTPDDLAALTEVYASPQPLASLIGWGLQRHAKGDQNVRFINALAFASGNLGREGGGAYFSHPSFRNLNPALIKAASNPSRIFSLPRMARELNQARPPVELIWLAGLNLANQVPDSLAVARALRKIPFKVVVDAFPTDTVDLADLVLPCALMLEKEDLAVGWGHDFVNHSAKILEPPGQARSDFEIAAGLARKLDLDFPSLEEYLDQALDSPWLETDLSRIRRAGFARAKRPRLAFEGGVFAHPDGLCRLPDKLDPEPKPEEGYPLRLLSLIRREATHSQILPEEQGGALPRAWVSPDSPGLAGLDKERPVFLASPLARLRVSLQTMDGLHPEAVVFRRGGWQKHGRGINQLIRPQTTELGGIAALYQQSVRLEN